MVPAGLLWLAATFRGLWASLKPQAAYVFVTMTAAGLPELLIKFAVGRTRPRLWLEQGEFTLHPFTHGWAVNSFPSGHSQAVWAAMIALSVIFPRYRWAFIAIAILVALSRVMLTVHWVSDALAGAWLGLAAAMIVGRRLAPESEAGW